jgi:hypothetical protein
VIGGEFDIVAAEGQLSSARCRRARAPHPLLLTLPHWGRAQHRGCRRTVIVCSVPSCLCPSSSPTRAPSTAYQAVQKVVRVRETAERGSRGTGPGEDAES